MTIRRLRIVCESGSGGQDEHHVVLVTVDGQGSERHGRSGVPAGRLGQDTHPGKLLAHQRGDGPAERDASAVNSQ